MIRGCEYERETGTSGEVGRFRPGQIANRMNWTSVPDRNATTAALHIIHVVPANGTTITYVNPLDPTGDMPNPDETGWLMAPKTWGTVKPAGKGY